MQGETLQEEPKEKTAEKKDAFAKYTVKDSVFTTNPNVWICREITTLF